MPSTVVFNGHVAEGFVAEHPRLLQTFFAKWPPKPVTRPMFLIRCHMEPHVYPKHGHTIHNTDCSSYEPWSKLLDPAHWTRTEIFILFSTYQPVSCSCRGSDAIANKKRFGLSNVEVFVVSKVPITQNTQARRILSVAVMPIVLLTIL